MTLKEAIKQQRAATEKARQHRLEVINYMRLAWDFSALDEIKLAIGAQAEAAAMHYIVKQMMKEGLNNAA